MRYKDTYCIVCSAATGPSGVPCPNLAKKAREYGLATMIHPADERYNDFILHPGACIAKLKKMIADHESIHVVEQRCVVCGDPGGRPMPNLVRRATLAGFRYDHISKDIRWEVVASFLSHSGPCRKKLLKHVENSIPTIGTTCFNCGKPGGASASNLFFDAARLRFPVKYEPGTLPTLHKTRCEAFVKSEMAEMQKIKDALGDRW